MLHVYFMLQNKKNSFEFDFCLANYFVGTESPPPAISNVSHRPF